MINLILAIGTVGMLCLLIAFILNLLKKITQDSAIYNILNVIGGALLTYYGYVLNSTPFVILEAIWTIFAIYKLTTTTKK